MKHLPVWIFALSVTASSLSASSQTPRTTVESDATPMISTAHRLPSVNIVDGRRTVKLFESGRLALAPAPAQKGSGTSSEEIELILQLFSVGSLCGDLAYEAIRIVSEAVFGAREMTGQNTFTGTLTQVDTDNDQWTYSPSPTDKLVIVYAGGPTVTFVITQFDGYIDGTPEDFADYHRILEFTVESGQNNLHVVSQSPWEGWNAQWTRSIVGTLVFRDELMSVNIADNGKSTYESGSGFVFSTRDSTYTGSAQTPSVAITVKEAYYNGLVHNSNIGQHVKNVQLACDSSTSLNGNTYAFQGAHAAWALGSLLTEGKFNVVIDSEYWAARGNLLKNGQVIGAVMYDGPVVEDTYWGPKLILRMVSGGGDIQIYSLSGEPFDPGGGGGEDVPKAAVETWILYE